MHMDRIDAGGKLTWQVPWVELVDVDVGDDGDRARRGAGAVAEVVLDQLLVRRVKPEAGRQHRRVRHDHWHQPLPHTHTHTISIAGGEMERTPALPLEAPTANKPQLVTILPKLCTPLEEVERSSSRSSSEK
jgi:hypothetical protein